MERKGKVSTRELLPVGNAAWRVSGTVDVYDLDGFLALCVCVVFICKLQHWNPKKKDGIRTTEPGILEF